MYIFLILAIVFAALESLALCRGWRVLEILAKPAVMIVLFMWLYRTTGLKGAAFWFGAGILFSLAGDLLLLRQDHFFIHGLTAFLMAQAVYVIGFNILQPMFSVWGLVLAVIVGLSSARLLRRILAAIRGKGLHRLILPVAIYGGALTFMLLSALLTLSNTDWKAGASLLVSFGALSFYLSDIILAWNKFVAPISNGRLLNISAYHLGQIALVAGAIMQFGR